MRPRPRALTAAAWLAALFIAVRVVYRVLFHGADGDGAVLLALPVWRLPPPFAHVEIFGPVTVDGLADAVVSAVPIALTILAFGVLNALVDVPRLIARGAGRGPFQGIARALSIAWATLPALVDGVRAARFAQRLRGERGGARLLAPVLERTLERASAVAAALELRGYAGRGFPGDCEHPVRIRGAAAGFGADAVVAVPSLDLRPGTLSVVAGATGAGKSTLLRTISGLHGHVDGGWVSGSVEVVGRERGATPPRDTAGTVGVVLQHPRDAFATSTVADEIGLALELRGVAGVIRDARVREVAERVGVAALLRRDVRALSAGEATLVAIAAAIVEHPILVLVDEPLADLDAAARARIVALLDALAHDAGVCVVVAEHRVAEFADVADAVLYAADGVIQPAPPGPAPAFPPLPIRVGHLDAAPAAADPALTATGITVRHGDRTAVSRASLTLEAGEVVALVGPNGAGKSSLLAALALPMSGEGTGTLHTAGTVALVPDASDDLFVRTTVTAECRAADRRAHLDAGTTASRFAALLHLDPGSADLHRRLAQHPRDLSAGERRCLAIAVQTARSPRVFLIDEPTRGLDPEARDLVARALLAQADVGVAVLFATHDDDFARALSSRVLVMDAGELGTPAAVAPRAPETEPPTTRRRAVADDHDVAPRAPDAPPAPERHPARRARRTAWRTAALAAANAVAAAAFLWPLLASAVPSQAQAAVPYIALALAPCAIIVVFAALDASVRSAHTLALLAVLAAIGAAVRIASTGVGGVEALFVLLILAGRAYGARFGLLLGAASIAVSAIMWGGVGPWLPFQMFACAWVGAGAGLLPGSVRGWREIAMLGIYGAVASYAFGLIMNMWFWPFAVGAGTSISYIPGGAVLDNLGNFLVYSLLTSTLGWDTLRAITTIIGLVVVGSAILAALRRAKPVVAAPGPAPVTARPPAATVDA